MVTSVLVQCSFCLFAETAKFLCLSDIRSKPILIHIHIYVHVFYRYMYILVVFRCYGFVYEMYIPSSIHVHACTCIHVHLSLYTTLYAVLVHSTVCT